MEDTGIPNEVAQMFVQVAEINLDPIFFKKLMDKSVRIASALKEDEEKHFKDQTLDLRVR